MSNHALINCPILITRGEIVFPSVTVTIDVGRIFSVAAVNKSIEIFDSRIIVVSQKDISVNEPSFEDCYNIGTLCSIKAVQEINGIIRVRLDGKERVKVESIS